MAQDIRIPRSVLGALGASERTSVDAAAPAQAARLAAGVAAPFGDAQAALLRRLAAGRNALVRPERHARR